MGIDRITACLQDSSKLEIFSFVVFDFAINYILKIKLGWG